jgi:hypothetical protein
MSVTQKNNGKKGGFCKVCFDAGKSEKVYKSHYVRSEPGTKGKVVCPLLLAIECNYCKEKGHTVKFCMIIASKKKNTFKMENRKNHEIKESKREEKRGKVSVNKNIFARLVDESSDEEDEKVVRKELSGWAAIVAKPFPVAKAKEDVILEKGWASIDKSGNMTTAVEESMNDRMVAKDRTLVIKRVLNWADDFSSDEEYEDNYGEIEEDGCW